MLSFLFGGLFSLIVAYGWFVNIAYIFNKGKKYKPNIIVQIVGIFMPVVGACVGYYTVLKNRKS